MKRAIRPLGAPEQLWQAQRLPGKNYSTARESRAISWTVSVSGRREGSSPARSSTCAADRPKESATGLSAFRRVFRRCRKTPRTTRSKAAGSPTSAAGGRNRSRTTAEVTFGGGRNAPGRQRQQPIDVGEQADLHGERAVPFGPGRGDDAGRPPPSAASPSRRESGGPRRPRASRRKRIGDETL